MKKHLIFVFEQIKKDFKLSKHFTITKHKIPFSSYWVYYEDKAVAVINENGESAHNYFSGIKEETLVTLLLTKVLRKKIVCNLKRKI